MPGRELDGKLIPAAEWTAAILPVLNEGHCLKIPVTGMSMYPLIAGGRDEVVLSSAEGKKLRRGDIVLYAREDGTHVLHRIHHIKNNSYFMLGDSQTFIEGPIKRENILAAAVSVLRKNRTISCEKRGCRCISSLWLLLRPLRPVILASGKALFRAVRFR